MRSYKTYSSYKPSNVDWVDKIPKHWELRKLKFVAQLRYGDSLPSESRDDGDIPVFGSNGIVGSHSISNTLSPCIIVGRKGSYGKVTFSNSHAFAIDTTYFIDERTVQTSLNFRWLYYALLTLKLDAFSQDTGVPGLSREFAHNRPLIFPPIYEQKLIASFLDRHTTRIDTLITKKRQLIDLLQKKRDTIINQLVTKGLNPKCPMKETALPWIPEIPAKWLKTKIKFVCSSVRDGTHNPPARAEGEYRLLSARNIQDGEFILREDDRLMDLAAFKELERSYTVRKGDVVVAVVGATTGKSAVVDDLENISVQRSIAILRPKTSTINPYYLNFWITNQTAQHEIKIVSLKYAAQGGIYLEDLANLTCVLPSLKEQEEILDFLEKVFVPVVKAEQKLKEQLEELQEYKQVLISNTVTGKIDVRKEVD